MRRKVLFGTAVAGVAVAMAIVSFRVSRQPVTPAPPPLWTKPAAPWKAPDFDAQVKLGDGHYDRGEHEQAIAAYERALAIRDSAYVRTNLGVSLHTVKRTDEALRHFARALELDPAYWKATFNELVIFANRKDYPRALARIERLRELQKTNSEIPPLDDLEQHLRTRAAAR